MVVVRVVVFVGIGCSLSAESAVIVGARIVTVIKTHNIEKTMVTLLFNAFRYIVKSPLPFP